MQRHGIVTEDFEKPSNSAGEFLKGIGRTWFFMGNDDTVGADINGFRIRIGIRDIIYVISAIIALSGLYFNFEAKLAKSAEDRVDIYQRLAELKTAISRMDDVGTNKSHEVDSLQQQQINQNTSAINEINHFIKDLTPKVDKIDTNLTWLMGKQIERK